MNVAVWFHLYKNSWIGKKRIYGNKGEDMVILVGEIIDWEGTVFKREDNILYLDLGGGLDF